MKPEITTLLRKTLAESETACGRQLSEIQTDTFCRYYEMVIRWNQAVHLTTITDPADFVRRHILEAVFAAQYLHPSVRKILDLGSGAGVPGIPFAILHSELSITLVDSDKKKATFLKETAEALKLANVSVLSNRIEMLSKAESDTCLTARAIERMGSLIPAILELGSESTQFLFFGGTQLREVIADKRPEKLLQNDLQLPFSHHRWLISLTRST